MAPPTDRKQSIRTKNAFEKRRKHPKTLFKKRLQKRACRKQLPKRIKNANNANKQQQKTSRPPFRKTISLT